PLSPILSRSTEVLHTCVNVGRSSSSPRTSFFWRMLSATLPLRSAGHRRRIAPRTGTACAASLLPAPARRQEVLDAGRVDQAAPHLFDERLPIEADLVAEKVRLVDRLEGQVDQREEGLHHPLAAHRDRLEYGLLVLGPHLRHRLGGGGVAQILL